jgi:hypothetical protein
VAGKNNKDHAALNSKRSNGRFCIKERKKKQEIKQI